MSKITSEDFGFFQSESLNVDFIGLNLTNLDSNQILKLASYFQTLGFNSYQKDREENKSRQELKIDLKNKFELTFISNVPYQKRNDPTSVSRSKRKAILPINQTKVYSMGKINTIQSNS